MLFESVLINLLGFDLLIWGVGFVLGELRGDVLQLSLVGFQLLLLEGEGIAKSFPTIIFS